MTAVIVIVVILLGLALVVGSYISGEDDGDAAGYTRGVADGRADLLKEQNEDALRRATMASHATDGPVTVTPTPAGNASGTSLGGPVARMNGTRNKRRNK